MTNRKDQTQSTLLDSGQGGRPHVRSYLEVDFEKFAHFLDESGLTEEQKRKYLQAVWTIIVGFVDLGFGVHPVQQSCGQLSEKSPKAPLATPDELYLEQRPIIEKFAREAGLETDRNEEGVGI